MVAFGRDWRDLWDTVVLLVARSVGGVIDMKVSVLLLFGLSEICVGGFVAEGSEPDSLLKLFLYTPC